jgi:hypothetical protein
MSFPQAPLDPPQEKEVESMEQEMSDSIVQAHEAKWEAEKRFGKKATVAIHFGQRKIGYYSDNGNMVVVGRGRSWDDAVIDAFGKHALSEIIEKKSSGDPT